MEENNEKVQESEIDLRVILDILKKNIIPLILVTAIFGAAFGTYSNFFITKQYSASALLVVNNKKQDSTVISSTEISAAQNLADVYAIIIRSMAVLSPVLKDEQLKEQFPKHNSQTYEKLRNSISVSSQNSTQVIKITMKDTDASYAKAVVGCIVQKAPDIIKYCVESASSVNEVDDVQIDNNGKPVSPNTLRNAIIGALVGFVLTLAVVFIREFTNNTFKTEEDIASALNIPLLGIIPSVDSKEFNKNV